MWVTRYNAALKGHIAAWWKLGYSIGFVPTMGALHEGHLSLIAAAKAECDKVVCSIFVNPTQFNDPGDLERYPRPVNRDIAMLAGAECDLLYLPDKEQIYPPGKAVAAVPDPGPIVTVMEGAHRPGHFDGVMMVVRRLLELVRPDALFMGQKDYQQVAVIRFLIKYTEMPVRLVSCPTLRASDGLALSSRNQLLTPVWREKAPSIYKILMETQEAFSAGNPRELEERALQRLTAEGFETDYFLIVEGYTLQPWTSDRDVDLVVACVAVRAGFVRLIDNLILRHP